MTARDKWLADRATGVGGSDAAAVCGLSKWATKLDVYMEKVGYLDGIGRGADNETPDMRRGTLLEPAVLQMYTDETGVRVRKPRDALVSAEYPFMRANVDGLTVPMDDIVIEGKTARSRSEWGEPWTAEIPLEYTFQAQHNMVVAKREVCHMPVLFGNFEFAIYEVLADREFQELMIEQEREFWAMVEARTPPDPVNDSDVSKRWPVSRPVGKKASRDALEIAGRLLAVREYAKELQAIEKGLEADLKRIMQEAEALVCGKETICTWRTAKAASKFDAKRFQSENPELAAGYMYQSAPSRRFLLKEGTQCLHIMKLLPVEKLAMGRNCKLLPDS